MEQASHSKQRTLEIHRQGEIERVPSNHLLLTNNKLIIEHAGEDYILRITKAGKLILTK